MENDKKKTVDIRAPNDEETAHFGGHVQLPTGEDVDFYGSPVQVATLEDIRKYASGAAKTDTSSLSGVFGGADKKKRSALNMLLELTDGEVNPESLAKAHRLIDEAAAVFMQHQESGLSNMQLILAGKLEADTPKPFENGQTLARRFSKNLQK